MSKLPLLCPLARSSHCGSIGRKGKHTSNNSMLAASTTDHFGGPLQSQVANSDEKCIIERINVVFQSIRGRKHSRHFVDTIAYGLFNQMTNTCCQIITFAFVRQWAQEQRHFSQAFRQQRVRKAKQMFLLCLNSCGITARPTLKSRWPAPPELNQRSTFQTRLFPSISEVCIVHHIPNIDQAQGLDHNNVGMSI